MARFLLQSHHSLACIKQAELFDLNLQIILSSMLRYRYGF